MISKKIVIGTANFGMKYGLDKNKLHPDEIKKIFNYCKKEGIKSLDTASGYKKSLENLKKNEIENWEIISKISSLPLHVKDVNSYVKKVFFTTLKKLDLQKIHTILIHDENDILNVSRGKKITKALNDLKKENLIKRVGSSIYDSYKIKKVINNYHFDVVQCPYNIFDKRIVDSGLLNLLQRKKTKIHIRSIFLQGLLLRNTKNVPSQFKKNIELKKYYDWLRINNLSSLRICLTELNKINFEKIVIGINNIKQLKEIVRFKKYSNKTTNIFKTNNLKLIDPRKWKRTIY